MITKRELWFDPAGENRTLHIYLPDSYNETGERYPVMYFFDGHNLFYDEDATYGKSWGLKDFLDSWEKPMIIVGIECSHTGNNRLSEYCPYDVNAGFLGHIKGTGAATMDWIVDTLKPVIDQEYRTYSFREATGIAGSSMGGLMALYTGIKYNTYFSKAACLSSSIGFCEQELWKEIADASLDEDTRIYLSWGENEAGPVVPEQNPAYDSRTAICNRRMAKVLAEEGILTSVYFQRNGDHNEASWEKLIPGFMNYLWRNQPIEA